MAQPGAVSMQYIQLLNTHVYLYSKQYPPNTEKILKRKKTTTTTITTQK